MAAAGGIWYARFGEGLGAVAMGLLLLYAARVERRRAPGSWVRYLARTLEAGRWPPVVEGRLLVASHEAPVKEVALRLLPPPQSGGSAPLAQRVGGRLAKAGTNH